MSLQCPPVAVAIAKLKKDGEFEKVANKIEFNVVELSDLLGWDSSPVKKELKLLEWNLGRWSLLQISFQLASLIISFSQLVIVLSIILDQMVIIKWSPWFVKALVLYKSYLLTYLFHYSFYGHIS